MARSRSRISFLHIYSIICRIFLCLLSKTHATDKDLRIGIQASQSGSPGAVRYTPWTQDNGGWSDWAYDGDEADYYTVGLLSRGNASYIQDIDIRIRIQGWDFTPDEEGPIQNTPWLSEGGGWSNATCPIHPCPYLAALQVYLDVRSFPGLFIDNIQVGLQMGYGWGAPKYSNILYLNSDINSTWTPWTGDNNNHNPHAGRISLTGLTRIETINPTTNPSTGPTTTGPTFKITATNPTQLFVSDEIKINININNTVFIIIIVLSVTDLFIIIFCIYYIATKLRYRAQEPYNTSWLVAMKQFGVMEYVGIILELIDIVTDWILATNLIIYPKYDSSFKVLGWVSLIFAVCGVAVFICKYFLLKKILGVQIKKYKAQLKQPNDDEKRKQIMKEIRIRKTDIDVMSLLNGSIEDIPQTLIATIILSNFGVDYRSVASISMSILSFLMKLIAIIMTKCGCKDESDVVEMQIKMNNRNNKCNDAQNVEEGSSTFTE
eukprot:472371_1